MILNPRPPMGEPRVQGCPPDWLLIYIYIYIYICIYIYNLVDAPRHLDVWLDYGTQREIDNRLLGASATSL